jgi:hypothetical protein
MIAASGINLILRSAQSRLLGYDLDGWRRDPAAPVKGGALCWPLSEAKAAESAERTHVEPNGQSGTQSWELPNRGSTVPQFDRELVFLMRKALEDVMSRVPPEISNAATKAFLAECILKAAAQGHTSYNELLTAATDHIQALMTMLS